MLIQNSVIANEYFVSCTIELNQISNTFFFKPYNYYSILCLPECTKKLAYLSKNEEFVKNFLENLCSFDIYKSDLFHNFEKILKLRDNSIEIEERLNAIFKDYFTAIIIRKLAENLCLEDLPL